jgi:hypothetical protein
LNARRAVAYSQAWQYTVSRVRPDFINLHLLVRQVTECLILVLRERLTAIFQQLEDGRLADASQTHDGANGHTFDHHFDDLGALHATLRCTPAMAAGVTKTLWEIADMVTVLEDWEIWQMKVAV